MSQTWTEHEKDLHKQYNIPAEEQLVAILQNGTIITRHRAYKLGETILNLPPPDDYGEESK